MTLLLKRIARWQSNAVINLIGEINTVVNSAYASVARKNATNALNLILRNQGEYNE